MEKKKSAVVYTITLDRTSGLPVEILESVIAICRPEPQSTKEEYYIFSTTFRMGRYGEVPALEVPPAAAPLMK